MSRLIWIVQTRLWGMKIDPTARIHPSALIDRTWPRGIHIEAGSYIAEEAVVLTHDLTRGVYLDTRIGAGTYIGARAIVLPGLTIGRDCIVMPGALVTKDLPPRSTAIGNPAKIVPIGDGESWL
jgi:acetyltransferase-like isoleucine patch superfamily enzyme